MKRRRFSLKCACILVMCIVMLTSSVAVYAAYSWQASIGFVQTDIQTKTKTNTANTTYVSFSGKSAQYDVNLYFSVYNNTLGVVSSQQMLIPYQDAGYLSSSAVRGNSLTLRAHREFIWDEVIHCSGTWTP